VFFFGCRNNVVSEVVVTLLKEKVTPEKERSMVQTLISSANDLTTQE